MCDELKLKVLELNDGEKGSRFRICNYNLHVMISLCMIMGIMIKVKGQFVKGVEYKVKLKRILKICIN
jgi:hypothetical protein